MTGAPTRAGDCVPDGGVAADRDDDFAPGDRPIARARSLLASAVNHSTDGEPVHVARRLDEAALLLEGQVAAAVWYRVWAAKHLCCSGRERAGRRELREAMGLLDAELEAESR